MNEKEESTYRPGWQWLGRSLENYKDIHAKAAADKGVGEELKNAKTLTKARKIVFGYKKKNTK